MIASPRATSPAAWANGTSRRTGVHTSATPNTGSNPRKRGAMDDGLYRHHLIIDPATGAVLGERSVTLANTAWLPGDTVTTFTAVSSAVVPTLGGTPAAAA